MLGWPTEGSYAERRSQQKPHAQIHLARHEAHAWPLKNCFPSENDIIDWTKYDSLNYIFSQNKTVVETQGLAHRPIALHFDADPNILTNNHSAIEVDHVDDKNNNIPNRGTKETLLFNRTGPAKPLVHGRKSPIVFDPVGRALTSLFLLVAAISGWRPIDQNAVSCLGSVSGGSIIRDNHNLPYNHPVLHSTHRNMNLNRPFWAPITGNPDLNNQHAAQLNGGDSLPTSEIESFYSDQSGPAAQSSVAPTANVWGSSAARGLQDSLDTHVRNILVPRVSGTPGNVKVRQYIVDTLEANDFTVQLDEFTDSTPVGKVKFANIIASSNPNACRQLVVACHYDSKMMDGFLGAVDSAVPCAMLLKMSETFKTAFRAKDGESARNSLGLQFIFFDGEEAFVEWGPTDSLYGSRHLAAKWDKQKPPQQCSGSNELSRIELLVLLDLIGSKDTSFVVYTSYDTAVTRRIQAHHNNFRKYEKAYLSSEIGLSGAQANRESAFKTRQMPIYLIEDDHVPFLKRGVPVLSLLASPFPKVWHTTADNYDAIDYPRTRRILHVLEKWLANYNELKAT